MARGADRIAHVVQRVEDRDEVAVRAGVLRRRCDLEAHPAPTPAAAAALLERGSRVTSSTRSRCVRRCVCRSPTARRRSPPRRSSVGSVTWEPTRCLRAPAWTPGRGFREGEKAGQAGVGLVMLANATGQPALEAEALFAAGRARRAAGAHALGDLDRALEQFSSLELPYEAARARLDRPCDRGRATGGGARRSKARPRALRPPRSGARCGPRRRARAPARRRYPPRPTTGERPHCSIGGDPRAPRRGALQPGDLRTAFPQREDGRAHVSRILAKLGLKRRAEAAAAFIRRRGAQFPGRR